MLEEIKQQKLKEVQERKELFPIKLLEKSTYFETTCVSLKKYVTSPDRSGIIAEFKRKSPSKGYINKYARVDSITIGYMQAGASALSILTDERYFGGKPNDLETARKLNYCPILRKDFIIDEYQVIESKSMGADAILLIAKLLTPKQIKELSGFAKNLGLEVLLETHSKDEVMNNLEADFDLAGINNRNLDTFEVNLENSIKLAELLPADKTKIAERGIESPEAFKTLRDNGFKGFLIGEYFMRHSNPAEKCNEFIKQISEKVMSKG